MVDKQSKRTFLCPLTFLNDCTVYEIIWRKYSTNLQTRNENIK